MNKLYLIAIGLLTTLAITSSCGKKETPEKPTPNPDPTTTVDVGFTSSITGNTGFTFAEGDVIAVSAYDSNNETTANSVKYTYGTDKCFASSSPIKLSDKLSYLAIYPYMAIPADKIASFSVNSDQSSESNYKASDLMLSTVSSSASAKPTLSFSRLLSKVVVEVEQSEMELSEATATLSAVASVEYNLSTLSATVPTATSSIKMLGNGDTFQAIIAPQTFEAGAFIAAIEVGGESYPINLDSEVTLGGGKEVTIPVTIFDGTITISAPVINDWTESGFENNEEDKTEDDGVAATISLADMTAPYTLNYSDLGGNRTIAVVSNKEQISFEKDPNATWLKVSTVGSKTSLLAFEIAENDKEERSAIVTITAGIEGNTASTELTITQGAAGSSAAYSVGDLVYDDDGKANGIVCYVSGDGTQVMALSFEVAELSWGSASLAADGHDIALPDMYNNFGVGDADNCANYLKGLSHYTEGYYPAFDWAQSLGEGWYIPTRSDWTSCIMPAFIGTKTDSDGRYTLETELNDKMVEAGGVSYDYGDYNDIRYWTCNTAKDDAEAKVYITRPYSDSLTKNTSKTSGTPIARAVKYIAM